MINSSFFSDYEAFASELLENIEEMFPRCHMHINVFSIFKYSTVLEWPVTKGLNIRIYLGHLYFDRIECYQVDVNTYLKEIEFFYWNLTSSFDF